MQRLRARSGAILSGIGTVLADDPSFTVRTPELADDARQPLRAILDSSLRMPLAARMLDLPGRTVVFCIDDTAAAALEQAGAEVVRVAASGDRVDLEAALTWLRDAGVNDVLVEAGPGLGGALLDAGLVDELVIYQAPHIMGSETATMVHTPGWQRLGDRKELTIIERRTVGEDLRIRARLKD